jgi:hypothetical protein
MEEEEEVRMKYTKKIRMKNRKRKMCHLNTNLLGFSVSKQILRMKDLRFSQPWLRVLASGT